MWATSVEYVQDLCIPLRKVDNGGWNSAKFLVRRDDFVEQKNWRRRNTVGWQTTAFLCLYSCTTLGVALRSWWLMDIVATYFIAAVSLRIPSPIAPKSWRRLKFSPTRRTTDTHLDITKNVVTIMIGIKWGFALMLDFFHPERTIIRRRRNQTRISTLFRISFMR